MAENLRNNIESIVPKSCPYFNRMDCKIKNEMLGILLNENIE